MKRRKKDSEDTRQHLLEAGLRVFSEKGFSVTRLEDVVRKAGFTRGAFYWHFRYKLDLFREIFSSKLNELHDETQALLQSENAPYEKLRRFILHIPTKLIEDDSFYAFGRLRYKIEWTDGLEEAVINPFLEKQAKENNRELVRLIDDGKASGVFCRELVTSLLVSMIEIFILGLTHQVLDGRKSDVLVEDVQRIVDCFLDNISVQR